MHISFATHNEYLSSHYGIVLLTDSTPRKTPQPNNLSRRKNAWSAMRMVFPPKLHVSPQYVIAAVRKESIAHAWSNLKDLHKSMTTSPDKPLQHTP